MEVDPKRDPGVYVDLNPDRPQDIPFYRSLLTATDLRVLELGCGTGRILTALAPHCRHIVGIDSSQEMLTRCRAKLRDAGISRSQATVKRGDITDFDLGVTFDLIIAPFVFQYLETDEQVHRFLTCIRKHLDDAATCVLNVPQPVRETEEHLPKRFEEGLVWETNHERYHVTCRRKQVRLERGVLHAELVYRSFLDDVPYHELAVDSVMRCWNPEQLMNFITRRGFGVLASWGGFCGEPFGSGPEVVIQFKAL